MFDMIDSKKRFSEDIRRGGDPLLIKSCDGIEQFLQHLDNTTLVNAELIIASIYNPTASYENPYQFLGNFFKFIHVNYVEKYRELICEIIEASNSRRYLSVALCGRSVIEATASLRFYNLTILKKARISGKKDLEGIDKQFVQDAFDLAIKHLNGSKMDWGLFFTSDKKTFVSSLVEREKRRLKKEPSTKVNYIESYPIYKFLDAWFDDEPELVALAYNFYSELEHPNLGSNLLLMGIDEGKIQIGKNSNRSIGKSICKESIKFLAPVVREASLQLANSILLSSLGDEIDSSTINH